MILIFQTHRRKPQPFIDGTIVKMEKVCFASRKHQSIFEITLFKVGAPCNMDILHIDITHKQAFETTEITMDGDIIHPYCPVELHIVEEVAV